MNLLKSEQKLELKKHVNLIHCSNRFSLIQRKLFNALLFNAYPELATKNQFTISAKELCEMIGYKSNDYKSLKKALLELITTAVEWNVINEGRISKENDKWRASAAISSATLEKGICTYEYSMIMKELFYQPEIYGRINIALLPRFKSSYGLALYENCVRYQGMPQTPWFKIETFRKLMGVEEDKYLVFRDFKKRILDIAVKEVNLHSALIISPEIKRIGKQVVSIKFSLKTKKEGFISSKTNNKTGNEADLINILVNEFGVTYKNAKNIFNQYEYNYIREKVNMIKNSNSFRSGKIENPAAYLYKGLKDDFKDVKQDLALAKEQHKKKEEFANENKKKKEAMQNDYNKYVTEEITNYISTLAEGEHKDLMDGFEVALKKEFFLIYNWFKKKGLNHPAVRSLFNKYVKERKTNQLSNLLNFEEFHKEKLEIQS